MTRWLAWAEPPEPTPANFDNGTLLELIMSALHIGGWGPEGDVRRPNSSDPRCRNTGRLHDFWTLWGFIECFRAQMEPFRNAHQFSPAWHINLWSQFPHKKVSAAWFAAPRQLLAHRDDRSRQEEAIGSLDTRPDFAVKAQVLKTSAGLFRAVGLDLECDSARHPYTHTIPGDVLLMGKALEAHVPMTAIQCLGEWRIRDRELSLEDARAVHVAYRRYYWEGCFLGPDRSWDCGPERDSAFATAS